MISVVRSWLVAACVGVLVTGLGYAVDAAAGGPASRSALGPGEVTVPVDIEHSRFSIDHLRVRSGTVVRFEVVNRDPIHHELIVGPDEVHRRHADGTELEHLPVPGEVSVGPNATGTTSYVFDEPGTVTFACHLPGHVAYGMAGTIEVVATSEEDVT